MYQNGKTAFDSRGNACIKKMQATVKQFLPNHGGAENVVALGAQPYMYRDHQNAKEMLETDTVASGCLILLLLDTSVNAVHNDSIICMRKALNEAQ